jgi:hypothetical protein
MAGHVRWASNVSGRVPDRRNDKCRTAVHSSTRAHTKCRLHEAAAPSARPRPSAAVSGRMKDDWFGLPQRRVGHEGLKSHSRSSRLAQPRTPYLNPFRADSRSIPDNRGRKLSGQHRPSRSWLVSRASIRLPVNPCHVPTDMFLMDALGKQLLKYSIESKGAKGTTYRLHLIYKLFLVVENSFAKSWHSDLRHPNSQALPFINLG